MSKKKQTKQEVSEGMRVARYQYIIFQLVSSTKRKTAFSMEVFHGARSSIKDLYESKNIYCRYTQHDSYGDDLSCFLRAYLHKSAVDWLPRDTVAQSLSRESINKVLKGIVSRTKRRLKSAVKHHMCEDYKRALEQAKEETISYKLEMLVGEPIFY